eukprot:3011940-Rhodomonas_salina.2
MMIPTRAKPPRWSEQAPHQTESKALRTWSINKPPPRQRQDTNRAPQCVGTLKTQKRAHTARSPRRDNGVCREHEQPSRQSSDYSSRREKGALL